MKSLKFLVPLGLFLVLALFLGKGLYLDPREVPSPFIGKPAPAFELASLQDPSKTFRRDDLLGQVWVLNVFASWCVPCLQEHPLLVDMQRRNVAPLVGLNYKDKPDAGKAFLQRHGNPYAATLVDFDGRVGIDYGVYGVPETFVIDKQGIVRFKHTGPLTPEVVQSQLEPLLKKLNG